MGSELLCVGFAAVTGLVYTASVAVLALPAHFAAKSGRSLTRCEDCVLQVLYGTLNTLSVVPLMVSTGNGPVSIAVPVMLATQLLSNMVVQSCAGSLHYNKAKRVGTYVLSAAAIQLVDVGPKEGAQVSSWELITVPSASAWLLGMCGLGLLCCFSVPCISSLPQNSCTKLLVFTGAVSVPSALNNSLSKVVAQCTGITQACMLGLYIAMGFSSTFFSGLGNAGLDNAISVPMFTCSQVILNGVTGIFVWRDLERTDNKIAYLMVYCLIFLGVYLCTSIDLLGKWVREKSSTRNLDALVHSESILNLPEREHSVYDHNGLVTAQALQSFLDRGSEEGDIHQKELIVLCHSLAEALEKTLAGSEALCSCVEASMPAALEQRFNVAQRMPSSWQVSKPDDYQKMAS